MAIDVDSYLSKTFHIKRYNCWHLLRDAWLDLTGDDLGERTPEQLSQASLVGRFDTDVPTFRLLNKAQDPSLVLMERRGVIPHVGVFFGGRILQITNSGPSYMPPQAATLGFETVRYYTR